MATVKAIKYGMKGDDVLNLQTSLKNAGYNIDVDGSFGPQTLAAVKQYQQKNGLTVDGMVGPQTSAVLFGGTSASTPANTTPTSGGTSGKNAGSGSAASKNTKVAVPDFSYDDFSYDDFSYGDYAESETVQQANAALNAILAAQPGAYQSKWQNQIDDIIGRILNREAFNYDFSEDALYKQYAEQYQRRGKMAMQDTMGQAAAMTGGYGSSYASTAGNQAYQEYLSQLNEVIPELYGLALDRYQMEGQQMYDQYGLLSDQEAQEYSRYMDGYNKWLAERDYATGRYNSERDYDYGKYVDDRNFAYGKYADDKNYAFNEYLTQIEQDRWQAEYDETRRQNDISNDQWNTSRQDAINSENRAYAREDVMNVISSGGTPTDAQLEAAGMSKETAQAMAAISSGDEEEALKHVGSMSTKELVDALETYAADGNNTAIEAMLDDAFMTERIDEATYLDWKKKYMRTAGHTITDTTVATPSRGTASGGRGSGLSGVTNSYK